MYGDKACKMTFVMDVGEDGQELQLTEEKKGLFCSADGGIQIVVEHPKGSEEGILYRYVNNKEKIDERMRKYGELLLRQFQNKYEEHIKEKKESLESGLEFDENDGENQESSIKVPYDPQLITVAQARFSLKEIVSMVDGEEDEEPVLDLAPAFQRDYVWDNVRKSRLIESILLNIPLPMFYFSRDKSGKLQVVDGLQRLTTIYKFFKNEFKLSKLEYLGTECEGKYFKRTDLDEDKSLRPRFVRALRRYQIDCNVIEPSTPENVKLDIFKRLNTGGKELNKQEVRHAFMKKNVRDFIKELVDSDSFQRATSHGVSDIRMMAQELVLRYIGFYCLTFDNFLNLEYMTQMNDFLDSVAVGLNNCAQIPYQAIKDNFVESMEKAVIMFGDRAFRKIFKDEKGGISDKKAPVNKSLFIAFSIMLRHHSMDKIEKRGNIVIEFANFLQEDADFYYAISHNTNYLLRDKTLNNVYTFLESIYGKGECLKIDS